MVLEVKIRDLKNSRDSWKERARKAERELKKVLKVELPKGSLVNEIRAKEDHYPILTNAMSIDRDTLVDLVFILDKEKLKSLFSLPVKNYNSKEESNSVSHLVLS